MYKTQLERVSEGWTNKMSNFERLNSTLRSSLSELQSENNELKTLVSTDYLYTVSSAINSRLFLKIWISRQFRGNFYNFFYTIFKNGGPGEGGIIYNQKGGELLYIISILFALHLCIFCPLLHLCNNFSCIQIFIKGIEMILWKGNNGELMNFVEEEKNL